MMNTASWCKAFELAVLLLLAMTAPLANGQGIIISITGPPDPDPRNPTSTSSGLLDQTPWGVSWTAMGAFSNVSLSITLDGNPGATGAAYLTTSIGPGTTTANEIASASFVFPSTSSLVPVLSGFNLGGGTYFLTIQQTASGSSGGGIWLGTAGYPTVTSAANVTPAGEFRIISSTEGYLPANTFVRFPGNFLLLTATGFPVPEPSPSSLILVGSGLAILGRMRKRIGFLR